MTGVNAVDRALLHAQRGYAVVPWHVTWDEDGQRVSDHPLTPHGSHDATRDAHVIREWWQRWPDAVPAIDCARSGVVAADCDVKHGRDGLAEWRALAGISPGARSDEHAWQPTPSGGRHYVYADPAGDVGCTSVGGLDGAPGVDVKGDGGMIFVYGSLPAVASLPRRPDVLAERVPARRSGAPDVDPFADPAADYGDRPPADADACRERLAALAERLASTADGDGWAAVSSLAFTAGTMAGAGQLPAADVERAMLDALDGWTWRRPRDERRLRLEVSRQVRAGAGVADRPWRADAAADGAASRPQDGAGDDADGGWTVDLGPWLDGTHEVLSPSVGASRDDGARLLYPARWHTAIGLTASGKSWLALWHTAAELLAGSRVVYVHFEETTPAGTLARLRALDVPDDVIRERLIWGRGDRRWRPGVMASLLAPHEGHPFAAVSLVVLDGINAACSLHAWPVNEPQAVGAYRALLVAPATAAGAAVLSLGHPPKARERQDERHGFGSTAWLDEVDGAGFRLEAARSAPIGRGRSGYSRLHVVKDRYGEVERHGRADERREPGWTYLGALVVDDTAALSVRLNVPADDDGAAGSTTPAPDAVDALADAIVGVLAADGADGTFASERRLQDALTAAGVGYRKVNVGAALARLEAAGRLEWPHAPAGKPRPGRLRLPPDVESDDARDGA